MRSIVNAPSPHVVTVVDEETDCRSGRSHGSEALLRDLWRLSRNLCLARLLVVEDALRATVGGELDEEVRAEAARQAHNLVGSLGLFGLTEGAELARTLERLIIDDRRDRRLLEQGVREVARLRLELEAADPLGPAAMEPLADPRIDPRAEHRNADAELDGGADRPVASPDRPDSRG